MTLSGGFPDHGVHIAYVDAQFQGGGGDAQCPNVVLELALHFTARAQFQVAVMQIGSLR